MEFDPRLYDDVWEDPAEDPAEEAVGEVMEEEGEEWSGRDDHLVEEERLGGREVRLLVRAEEELATCRGFTRLVPQERGVKYLKYLPKVSAADKLLAAWEARWRLMPRPLLVPLLLLYFHLLLRLLLQVRR